MGLSQRERDICAALLPPGGRSVEELAVRFGVKPITVYQTRLRVEAKLGMRLPRPNRFGRPLKSK